MVAVVVRANDDRGTHSITAAARIVRRSPHTMQKDEKGGV